MCCLSIDYARRIKASLIRDAIFQLFDGDAEDLKCDDFCELSRQGMVIQAFLFVREGIPEPILDDLEVVGITECPGDPLLKWFRGICHVESIRFSRPFDGGKTLTQSAARVNSLGASGQT